jgi:hypothetical protein
MDPRSELQFPAGVGTLFAVLLAFLAFDDITTDNATGFYLEYAILAGCCAWCLLVILGLLNSKRRILAAVSAVVLAAALWGQRAIGPGTVPSWRPEYVATVSAVAWFLLLSLMLIALGARSLLSHGD